MHLPAPRLRLAAVFALLLTAFPAPAVILKLVPLKEVLEKEELIFVASVDKVDPDKPAVVFKFEEKLKGEIPFEKIPVNLTGDTEAKKGDHTKVMFDRLEPGRKLIVFTTKEDKLYSAFVFMEGTWFQIQGTLDADGKTVRWSFLHCEPYLRRTFKGTTAELKKVVEDGLAKKAEPPKPNPDEKPGYGEPLKKKCEGTGDREQETGDRRQGTGDRGQNVGAGCLSPVPCSLSPVPLFGVIPSFVLVGPLAIIAALFPGVAARMAVGMKRWRAFLIIASMNSTLALVYFFLYEHLPNNWASSLRTFTVYLLLVTAGGLVWAGRRYRRMAGEEPAITGVPRKNEFYALGGLTLLVGLIVASVRFFGPWSTAIELPMREFTFIGIALLVATLYAGYRTLTAASDKRPDGTDPAVRLSLSGECVGLGTLFLCGLTAVLLGGSGSTSFVSGTEAGDADDTFGPRLVGQGRAFDGPGGHQPFKTRSGQTVDVTVFEVPEAGQVMSSITVSGNRLYFGAGKATSFRTWGYVVCMDRDTGKVNWKFGGPNQLKQVFCSPTVADGKVYCGEGLHTDTGCRLFCLRADSGEPAWENPFTTGSHTEGTPRVADGKVFFSAGDDGLFCAAAATGAKKWQFPDPAGDLHIDTPPTVVGGRVFAGSGYGTYALLCIDANSGKEVWRTKVPLRSFGQPLVPGKFAFYGIGTGNLTQEVEGDEKTPAGAVMCVEAATGKEVWKYDLTRSVHTSLAADAFSIYATSRDGYVHCLDRKTGKLRWKTGIGGAVTAGAAVATAGGFPVAVYAVSREGNVVCLNPQTGKVAWQKQLPGFQWRGDEGDSVFATPAVVTTETPTGSKRTIYIGGMTVAENTLKKTCAVFRFEDELGE